MFRPQWAIIRPN